MVRDFFSRHADLVAVCREAPTFNSDNKVEFEPKYDAASPLFKHHTTSLVFNDPAGESSLITLVDGMLSDLQTNGAAI